MSGYKNVSSYTEQEDGSCVYSTSSHTSTSDSGKIDPNESSESKSVDVTSSIFGTHTLTQEAGPCTDPPTPPTCVTGLSAEFSDINDSCQEINGERQTFTLSSTTLVNGVCTTTTTPYSDKKVYFEADGQGAVIPKNTATTTASTTISVWYYATTDQFFSFNYNGASVPVNGSFKVIQAEGPCDCLPGTDNNGSAHPLLWLADTTTEDDVYINGMTDTCVGSISYSSSKSNEYRDSYDHPELVYVEDFASGSIVGSEAGVRWTSNSRNTDWRTRVAVYTITNTCPNNGICESWDTYIQQGGSGSCSCSDINWSLDGADNVGSIPATGGTYKCAHIDTTTRPGCIDEIELHWGSDYSFEPPDWITNAVCPSIGTAAWITITVAANTTGASRSVTLYMQYDTLIENNCPTKEIIITQLA